MYVRLDNVFGRLGPAHVAGIGLHGTDHVVAAMVWKR